MRKIRKAVIPAAGMGTRFLPATVAQPKEMLTIVDKPVIQYVVEEAVASGIKDILIITGRHKRAIEDHFDPSYELEELLQKKQKSELLHTISEISTMANIHFVRQRRQKGLADAIYQAKSYVGSEPFAVLLGDNILASATEQTNLKQMMDIYQHSGKSVVALQKTPKEKISQYGVVGGHIGSGGVVEISEIVEKPEADKAPSDLAVASRYIFAPGIFNLIEKIEIGKGGELQITDAMKMLVNAGELLGYQIKGERFDIGNKVDFIKTNIRMSLERKDISSEIKKYIKTLQA